MSNTFDKQSVLDSFIEEVNSYLPEIDANLARLAQSPGDMDALEETYRRTHTIGGSASMMDFPGLAHVAHGMEDVLGDALDGLIRLDEHALGLLHRSLGRLRQLLEGIRGGIDEESVIAEDDADYSRYRSLVESGGGASGQPTSEGPPQYDGTMWETGKAPALSTSTSAIEPDAFAPAVPFSAPFVSTPPVEPLPTPSFDEVLASFRTPSLEPGEEMAWPEDPVGARLDSIAPPWSQENGSGTGESRSAEQSISPGDMSWLGGSYQTNSGWENGSEPAASLPVLPPTPLLPPMHSQPFMSTGQSALEALMESARSSVPINPPTVPEIPQVPPTPPLSPSPEPSASAPLYASEFVQVPEQSEPANNIYQRQQNLAHVHGSFPGAGEIVQDGWVQAYGEVQHDTQSVEEQAKALKQVVEQLREAMVVIEEQRGEFRGFLDGSKDALERMEEWAGRAMGLNLRNSPEQVRRYLPLSVMWVSNSKLKKVLDLLEKLTGGVEATDEQIAAALRQLQYSLQACGDAFQQATTHFKPESGWTPWEMQVAQDPATLHQRVTFERQGDPTVLRAELEASLREEIKREYEAQYRSQAELERSIREEVRQEYEERLLQQEKHDQQEVDARLRRELEIQVRQELLSQIAHSGGMQVPGTEGYVDMKAPPTGVETAASESVALPSTAPARPATAPPASLPTLAGFNRAPVESTSSSSTSSFATDFGEEAAEIFRMEAEEHLQTIGSYVAALEKDPHNRDLIQGIRRATHTLKGAAGMMGFRLIADLSHISEDLLDTIMEGTVTISPPVLSIILDTSETLDLLIAGRGEPASDEARVRALQARYTELLGDRSSVRPQQEEEDLDLDEIHHHEPIVTGVLTDGDAANAVGAAAPRANKSDLTVRVRLQRLDELVTLFGELLVNRSVLEERLHRLTRLVSDVGVSSDRLRDVGQKLESRFEAATLPSGRSVQVMPGEGTQRLLPAGKGGKGTGKSSMNLPAHLAEFDELELDRYTEFHQLARGLSEGISDMVTLSTEMDTIIRECEGVFARENRLSTQFQDRLMKTRLVPLSQLTPRIYRAARAVALKQKKEFEFLRDGESTEVDRTVFEEIGAPLLHLVRNAANHALETPEERIRKGKAPVGQIKFSAAYEGNQIVISISDDGKGLDREQIRQTAIARGLIRPDHSLSEGDFVSLIFHPGFSTAAVLSEESGRGVGLDVVRDTVSRLRGTIVVESAPDQGTTFTMTFPTSLAIQRAMMIRIAGQQFAIPTVHVESIGRFDNFKHVTTAGRPAVLVRNEPYPLQMLAQYLAQPNTGIIEEKAQLLLVNASGHRIALVVDEIKGQSDIVMKNLGPHLRQVHGIAGATVLGNGLVVLVLELNTLLSGRPKGPVVVRGAATPTTAPSLPNRRERDITPPMAPAASTVGSGGQASIRQQVDMNWQGSAGMVSASGAAPAPKRGKHVLVVDDSPSVRRVVSNMLKQHGWEVQQARDGIEAEEMITREAPAAVLLDIEMPRMDGYELISTIRAQEQFRTLPLIVLTSRAGTKHQHRAMSLGASAYVIKPYQDEELLSTINSLVFGTVPR